jgi:hypothetical protein
MCAKLAHSITSRVAWVRASPGFPGPGPGDHRSMKCLSGFVSAIALAISIATLQGCRDSTPSVGGVSPEFRKADLESQRAMQEYMQSQKPKGKTKGKARSR